MFVFGVALLGAGTPFCLMAFRVLIVADQIPVLVLLGLVVAGTLGGIGFGFVGSRQRVTVGELGLAKKTIWGSQVILWEEVESIEQVPVIIEDRNVGAYLSYQFRLLLDSGDCAYFDHAYPELRALISLVQRKASQAHFPEASQAFQAGKKGRFGTVTLSREGLRYDGGLLPIDQIGEVDVVGGKTLMIYSRFRNRVWAEVPLAEIENLGLLRRLLDWLQGVS